MICVVDNECDDCDPMDNKKNNKNMDDNIINKKNNDSKKKVPGPSKYSTECSSKSSILGHGHRCIDPTHKNGYLFASWRVQSFLLINSSAEIYLQ